ncbi:hypothetical protein [Geoalkalibacter subterraneus]|nr:hypothetical protein [Geoalkalibacter subterraneus]
MAVYCRGSRGAEVCFGTGTVGDPQIIPIGSFLLRHDDVAAGLIEYRRQQTVLSGGQVVLICSPAG